jgi:HK97 family phage major capsid protein
MAVSDVGIPMGLPTVDGFTRFDRQRYSIVKIIRHIAGDADVDISLEQEVSEQIAKRLKKTSGNFYVPTRIRSGLDTKTNAAGAFTVETELQDLIELLRARTQVIRMGATLLTGLSSTAAFPVQLTGSTGSWVAENPGSDLADSDSSFGQKTLSPKMYEANTSYSRKLLAQATMDVEAFVLKDLAKAHALGLDAAAINGSGASNQPLGLLGTTGIGNVALGVNGLAPTYANIADLETAVSNADADADGMAFLTTPIMRAKLRNAQQFSGAGVGVWQQVAGSKVGNVLGYDGFVSRQVPSTLVKGTSSDCHGILFGYWPALIIGEWGVLEILVDPYRLKKQGMIEITSYLMADILIQQPASFAAIKDARNI